MKYLGAREMTGEIVDCSSQALDILLLFDSGVQGEMLLTI